MNTEQHQNTAAPRAPQTLDEALQLVDTIAVPTGLYLTWMRRLAPVPSQYAGGVYDSMDQLLASAIAQAAEQHRTFRVAA